MEQRQRGSLHARAHAAAPLATPDLGIGRVHGIEQRGSGRRGDDVRVRAVVAALHAPKRVLTEEQGAALGAAHGLHQHFAADTHIKGLQTLFDGRANDVRKVQQAEVARQVHERRWPDPRRNQRASVTSSSKTIAGLPRETNLAPSLDVGLQTAQRAES